jgi:hypothetical protein
VLVKSSYLDQQILIALSEHLGSGGFTGPLNNCSVALLMAGFNPSSSTVFGDLTEATYSGYARATGVVWGVPILQNDGSYQILTALLQFQAAAASNFVQNTIYGWAMISPGGSPQLLMCEVFQAPVPFATPNDGFGLVIQLSEGQANPASYGNLIR